MSDISGGYDGLSDEDLFAMLLGNAPTWGTPAGKTPASQLNYYQDLVSTLGFDPVQQAGLGDTPEDQWTPEEQAPVVSLNRQAYGSNPVAAQMFDLIDQGSDPISALAAVQKAHPEVDWKPDNYGKNENLDLYNKLANDYAFESAKAYQSNLENQTKTQNEIAKHQASYTAPDGSKYKNAPLGGNDIYGTASEYDLLGDPTVDQYLQQLVGSKLQYSKDRVRQVNKNGLDQIIEAVNTGLAKGKVSPGNIHLEGSAPSNGVSATVAPDLLGRRNLGKGNDMAGKGSKGSSWQYEDTDLDTKMTRSPSKSMDPNMDLGRKLVNGDEATDRAYRAAAADRLAAAQQTRVRSDANNNAMRRAALLKAVLG